MMLNVEEELRPSEPMGFGDQGNIADKTKYLGEQGKCTILGIKETRTNSKVISRTRERGNMTHPSVVLGGPSVFGNTSPGGV